MRKLQPEDATTYLNGLAIRHNLSIPIIVAFAHSHRDNIFLIWAHRR